MPVHRSIVHACLALSALPAIAVAQSVQASRDSGPSVVWVFANISFAGMRAQNNPSFGWRAVAFIFGFPGTLLSFFVIKEGSERLYGVDVPRKLPNSG